MFKFPCPTEEELDKVKASMWREVGGDTDKLVELIKQRAKQALEEHGYYIKPTGPNIGIIIRDKGKNKYKA